MTEADEQAGLKAAGQRNISLVWERTQQVIAICWSLGALGCALLEVARQGQRSEAAWTLLAGTLGTVIGFYFSRTNHQRVGGPGGDSAGTR